MKIFVLAFRFMLYSINASNVYISPNPSSPIEAFPTEYYDPFLAEEISDKIIFLSNEEKIYSSCLNRTHEQLNNLRNIHRQKGDILLNTERCSTRIRQITLERTVCLGKFKVLQTSLTGLKKEYEALTGSHFTNPLSIPESPASTPPASFKSPLYLKRFTVMSAGKSTRKSRLHPHIEKEASLNCLAPVAILDPFNPIAVKLAISLRRAPSQLKKIRTQASTANEIITSEQASNLNVDLPSSPEPSLKRTITYESFDSLHEIIASEQASNLNVDLPSSPEPSLKRTITYESFDSLHEIIASEQASNLNVDLPSPSEPSLKRTITYESFDSLHQIIASEQGANLNVDLPSSPEPSLKRTITYESFDSLHEIIASEQGANCAPIDCTPQSRVQRLNPQLILALFCKKILYLFGINALKINSPHKVLDSLKKKTIIRIVFNYLIKTLSILKKDST